MNLQNLGHKLLCGLVYMLSLFVRDTDKRSEFLFHDWRELWFSPCQEFFGEAEYCHLKKKTCSFNDFLFIVSSGFALLVGDAFQQMSILTHPSINLTERPNLPQEQSLRYGLPSPTAFCHEEADWDEAFLTCMLKGTYFSNLCRDYCHDLKAGFKANSQRQILST